MEPAKDQHVDILELVLVALAMEHVQHLLATHTEIAVHVLNIQLVTLQLVTPMAHVLLAEPIQLVLLAVDMQVAHIVMGIHMEQVLHVVVLDIILILAIVQIIIKLIWYQK
jgi:hypothetical protein